MFALTAVLPSPNTSHAPPNRVVMSLYPATLTVRGKLIGFGRNWDVSLEPLFSDGAQLHARS